MKEKDCIIVPPSEWGRSDLLNKNFIELLKKQQDVISSRTASCAEFESRSFANSMLVANPQLVHDRERKLWVHSRTTKILEPANILDVLRVKSFLPSRDSSFAETIKDSGWECSSNLSYFKGRLLAV